MDIVKSYNLFLFNFLRSSFEKINFFKGNIVASKKKTKNWHLPFCKNYISGEKFSPLSCTAAFTSVFCSPLLAKQTKIFINAMWEEEQEETFDPRCFILSISLSCMNMWEMFLFRANLRRNQVQFVGWMGKTGFIFITLHAWNASMYFWGSNCWIPMVSR